MFVDSVPQPMQSIAWWDILHVRNAGDALLEIFIGPRPGHHVVLEAPTMPADEHMYARQFVAQTMPWWPVCHQSDN